MVIPYVNSTQWCLDPEDGEIFLPDAGRRKFYDVRPNPTQGNPIIFQATCGIVHLSVVHSTQIVCEPETLYDRNMKPFQHYRVARRSFHNPDSFVCHDPIDLCEVYSNSQRIMGAPDKLLFQRLPELPDGPYVLMGVRDALMLRDGLGHAAIARALVVGLLEL